MVEGKTLPFPFRSNVATGGRQMTKCSSCARFPSFTSDMILTKLSYHPYPFV